MKVGIIFCIYDSEDFLRNGMLNAWVAVKNDSFCYSCVSAPFKGYEAVKVNNGATIKEINDSKIMDRVFIDDLYISETEARGRCLNYLKSQNCDISWQVDGDEIYTVDQINAIIKYVEARPNIAMFKLSLKNYFGNPGNYLALPFTPARIHRIDFPPFKIHSFFDDNNCWYSNSENSLVTDLMLRNTTIPKEVAWIPHYSWINGIRSVNKIKYQKSRGWTPTYKYDENNNITFNERCFTNQPIPEVLTDLV